MSDIKEKLSKLMVEAYERCWSTMCPTCKEYDKKTANIRSNCQANLFADYLIANGVRLETETSDKTSDEKTSEWIPVSERLPENWEDVLVCDARDDYVSVWQYMGDGLWLGNEVFWATEDITHWMPLPEPPKEE